MNHSIAVVEQIRRALQKQNRLAMACGGVLGGFVPIASYVLAHYEAQRRPLVWVLVAGALLFSALSVYEFGGVAFRHKAKAAGFVVLIEGVLVFSVTAGLGLAALALLVIINAVSTGTNLALDQRGAQVQAKGDTGWVKRGVVELPTGRARRRA